MSTGVALLIFIIIVLILWWALTRSAKSSKPDIKIHHEEHGAAAGTEEAAGLKAETVITPTEPAAPEKMAEVAATEPPGETAARMEPSVAAIIPDDLASLEGIGPKVNTILQQAGIQTFAQLAKADVEKLKEILTANGLQFMDPTSWPEQAGLAAQGKQEELMALQARLKGGRLVE